MLPEIDSRDRSLRTGGAERLDMLDSRTATFTMALPGRQSAHIERLNALTGNPVRLMIGNAPATSGPLIRQALDFAHLAGNALGFTATEAPEFLPDPMVVRTSSGTQVVHLHQHYQGIPIFQMTRAVHFSSENKLRAIVGDNVSIEESLGDIEIEPQISVVEAMAVIADYISRNSDASDGNEVDAWGQPLSGKPIDLSNYTPKIYGSVPLPSQPSILEAGPFSQAIPAHLTLFYQGPSMRLGWQFVVTLPKNQGQYLFIVGADAVVRGELLYVRHVTFQAFQGRVYVSNPGEETRKLVSFPPTVSDYPVPPPANLPPSFPFSWIEVNTTIGNNTMARSMVMGPGGQITFLPLFVATDVQGVLTFDAAGDSDASQQVTNIFYFCNYMHDFFYMLGFDEASGNFQVRDLSGGAAGSLNGDPVAAVAWDSPVDGTANMEITTDGWYPQMNMGVLASTGRHTALDADVVFHEYTHGVTNRLVGGRLDTFSLQAEQSAAMSEGWSDYFAISVQNFFRSTEKVVSGDWLFNNPAGSRIAPYDENFPAGLGQLGFLPFVRQNAPHVPGAIWCAALMAVTRRAVAKLGKERGYFICWQSVVDGLKLTAANPSFLDARDGMLVALDDLKVSGRITDAEHKAVRRSAWEAFAKFGMGVTAMVSSPNILDEGLGVVADFTLPPDLV